MEKSDVTGTIKHFCGNNQESKRHTVNAVVSERALREIYLKGYEIAVKEGKAKGIMTAYNQINGTYANESEHLLGDILYDEWKYEGMVVSDWGGSNDHGENGRKTVDSGC